MLLFLHQRMSDGSTPIFFHKEMAVVAISGEKDAHVFLKMIMNEEGEGGGWWWWGGVGCVDLR